MDRVFTLTDPSRAAWDDPSKPRPVRVHVWEPSAVDGRLVLLSHGTGASAQDLAWLAEPLVSAGFLVAAVDHHGNNWVDGYLAQGFVCVWERPADISYALSELAHRYDISWVGAAGFSAGGYTTAALLGARLDPELIEALAEGRIPAPDVPEFPGAFDWLTLLDETTRRTVVERSSADLRDERVSAGYVICPGDAGATTESSLRAITRPVEIRWGDADTINPSDRNAFRYLRLIPGASGRSLGPDVEHSHLFPDNIKGADARAAAAAGAVEFFTRVSATGSQRR